MHRETGAASSRKMRPLSFIRISGADAPYRSRAMLSARWQVHPSIGRSASWRRSRRRRRSGASRRCVAAKKGRRQVLTRRSGGPACRPAHRPGAFAFADLSRGCAGHRRSDERGEQIRTTARHQAGAHLDRPLLRAPTAPEVSDRVSTTPCDITDRDEAAPRGSRSHRCSRRRGWCESCCASGAAGPSAHEKACGAQPMQRASDGSATCAVPPGSKSISRGHARWGTCWIGAGARGIRYPQW